MNAFCEYCYTPMPAGFVDDWPGGWELVWNTAVCSSCLRNVELNGGWEMVGSGAFSTGPDPRPSVFHKSIEEYREILVDAGWRVSDRFEIGPEPRLMLQAVRETIEGRPRGRYSLGLPAELFAFDRAAVVEMLASRLAFIEGVFMSSPVAIGLSRRWLASGSINLLATGRWHKDLREPPKPAV